MNPIRRLFAHFQAYHAYGQPILQHSGAVGMAAFPLFYLLRFTKADAPFDDLGLRIVAMLLCAGLALRERWPRRLQPYFLAYAYLSLLYCMPFFFAFTALVNGGGTIGVANTLMAVFFLVLLSDWRNSVVMLVIGIGAAAAAYVVFVPDTQFPRDYVARLPILLLVVVGGSVFKFSEKQAEMEKVRRTYAALAASIAHEMRNPFGQIKRNLERIQQALPAPGAAGALQPIDARRADELYRHVADSEQAVKRGLQVIAMTLDEVNAKPVEPGSLSYLSAADTTLKAVDEYGYDSEADRSRVVVSVQEDFTFRGDETAYLFVLFNLIKNALYYLPLKPELHVTITIAGHKVTVRDSGPGMDRHVADGLFEPFASVGKAGGTGLGLAYCRRVMQAFGGDIRCASALGEYTEFVLSFPPVDAQRQETERMEALQRARSAFVGKRLLIVDDDAAQRLTTRHKLLPLGAEIDEAPDGLRAMGALARRRYDLVLLDLNMPVLDGYEFTQRVRHGRAPLNRHVGIVAHTSEPAHLAIVKTRNAGMDGYVVKPCAQLQLVRALEEALERCASRARPDVLAGRRVLLADDSPQNRRAVAAYLKHAGATVVEAGHGGDVLERLQEPGHWDAVLMDINMPGMDGLETARAIRASDGSWRAIPIIALTAHSDDHTVRAAQSAGMSDFIIKPVEAAVLYEKLAQLVTGSPRPSVPLRPTFSAVAPGPADSPLNRERLESYARLGMLQELLDDYLPEIAALAARLEQRFDAQDLAGCLDTLHSLLGMSGEAGAQALYQAVRAVYVPMVESLSWPREAGWVARLAALAAETGLALKEYGVAHSTPARPD